MRQSLFLFFFAMLFAAIVHAGEVPVVEATTFEPIPPDGVHVVMRGETFYSIAWRYGVNYKTLATENKIKRPYPISIGERIYLPGYAPKTQASAPPVFHASVSPPKKPTLIKKLWNHFSGEPVARVSHWLWPARGTVIGGYSEFNKGINIGGKRGDPVYAAASGKIVYNGNGLRTYGNLIIIKHNSTFLTAYAHNTKTLVHQGEWVRAGQKIAEMGSTGTNRVMLHFEIRKEGSPINPLRLLSTR